MLSEVRHRKSKATVANGEAQERKADLDHTKIEKLEKGEGERVSLPERLEEVEEVDLYELP